MGGFSDGDEGAVTEIYSDPETKLLNSSSKVLAELSDTYLEILFEQKMGEEVQKTAGMVLKEHIRRLRNTVAAAVSTG